jgi:Protein of unknown function (DUF5131)
MPMSAFPSLSARRRGPGSGSCRTNRCSGPSTCRRGFSLVSVVAFAARRLSGAWSASPDAGLVPPLIEWVICGGESGPRARPTHPAWARSLRDQCGNAGVPFFFKQWGEWGPQNGAASPLGDAWQNPHRHRWVSPDDGRAKPFGELNGTGDLGWAHMKRVGKKAAGRELDGQIRDEFPRHLAGSGHAATGCTI